MMRCDYEDRPSPYPRWLRAALLTILSAVLALFIFALTIPIAPQPAEPAAEQPIQIWTDPPPGRMF